MGPRHSLLARLAAEHKLQRLNERAQSDARHQLEAARTPESSLPEPPPVPSAESIGHPVVAAVPPHYKSRDGSTVHIEAIEAIEAALGDHFPEYCRGEIIRLVWRAGRHRDAVGRVSLVADLRVAAYYLHRWMKWIGLDD